MIKLVIGLLLLAYGVIGMVLQMLDRTIPDPDEAARPIPPLIIALSAIVAGTLLLTL